MAAVEAGQEPVAGEERLEGWDLELDRLFVGLRRAAGVVAGPGGDAFVRDQDGRRLIDAGIVSMEGDRLMVNNPMLTDEVLRVVLGLDRPLNRDHRSNGDTLRVDA
jgi:hypothetical protein